MTAKLPEYWTPEEISRGHFEGGGDPVCLLTLAARPLRPLGGRCSGPLTALLQVTPEGKRALGCGPLFFFGGGAACKARTHRRGWSV